jgi:hypothetical protein
MRTSLHFQPFVINAIELDVNTPQTAPMSLHDLPIPMTYRFRRP